MREDEVRRYSGNVLLASQSVLSNKPPTRKDDLVSLAMTLLFLLEELPYRDKFNFMLGRYPKSTIHCKMLKLKTAQTPETYCVGRAKCLLPFFQAVNSMAFADEPDYAYLRFLLKCSLHEQGGVDSECVMGLATAPTIRLSGLDPNFEIDPEDEPTITNVPLTHSIQTKPQNGRLVL